MERKLAKRGIGAKRYVDSNGYVRLVDTEGVCGRKNALVLEHRLVMARKIGRPLAKDEFVHHIDGNRANNDPSNLVLVDARDHYASHRGRVGGQTRFFVPYPEFEGDVPWLKLRCPTCGRIFYRRRDQSFLADDSEPALTFCRPSCSRRFASEHQGDVEDAILAAQRDSLVCEFRSNDEFMHVYLRKRGKRHLIDDSGTFRRPKRGYMLTQGEKL